MATLIPVTQPTNVEAAYEDMFKEITRKLYGEETGNGLHTLGTPVAHVVSSGPTAPEGEERSFTTLMSDRNLAPTIEYEQHPETSAPVGNTFKTEEHLTTAFGLAALMQNGFAATTAAILPKTITSNATITSAGNHSANNNNNPTVNNTGGTTGNNSTGNDQQQQQRWNTSNEAILPWPTTDNKLTTTTFNATPKPNKSSNNSRKNKNTNNQAQNITTGNNNNQQQQQQQPIQQKRYGCTHCPYSTDRRDLYTRHENIHKDEKPFQCYACLKQFNRADHVKKHFLRMHRELTYDINKTRRNVNQDQKPTHLFNHHQNNNNNNHNIADNFLNSTNQRTAQHETSSSLSIAQTIESVATAQVGGTTSASTNNSSSSNNNNNSIIQLPVLKQEKMSPSDDKSTIVKVKKEKRFTCCYCPWSGADKWGLKRHLNTHTKPFVCMLCDYKAARSERLATHVLKVHNKKACNKCSFLADNQDEFQTHMNEIHPHDNRPSRNSNSTNVLRTIGNTLTTNNQINNFQNPNTSFGLQTTNSGVTTNYTNNNNNTDLTNNSNNGNNLQDIIVNPTSMVGWRLSASGSLIPPAHLHESVVGLGGSSSGNPNQKRGAERLFQYLEADGSDPEDYARQLKMDAISRNTASVAQDFHNAGGVVSNNNNSNTQNLTPPKYSPREAAAAVYLQQEENQENNNDHVFDLRTNDRKISTTTIIASNKKDEAEITANQNSNNKNSNQNENNNNNQHHIKAMSSFLLDQQLFNKSPPAYLMNQLTQKQNLIKIESQQSQINNSNNNNNKGHRLDMDFNKENKNLVFDNMSNENVSKLNLQFQNYIKDIINYYYAETPLFHPNLSQKLLAKTETENYIEYLKNKEDITLIVTPKKPKLQSSSTTNQQQQQLRLPDGVINLQQKNIVNIIPIPTPPPTLSMIGSYEKRNRKQAQPKKVLSSSHGPEIAIALLRDKYLKKLVVDRKRSCITCTNNKSIKCHMLVFPYHTLATLVLHRLWKHMEKPKKCQKCNIIFLKSYSLKIHLRTKHKRY